MRALCWMALLVPAAALPAQLISPGHFNLAEGNLGISDGIGSGAHKNRFLQLIKMNGRARSINWIDVRRDGDTVNVYEEGAVVADMFVSHAAKSFPTHNATFDLNHGTDKTQVATSSVFLFPETKPGPIPHNWDYRWAFDQPFQYGGRKAFCWEVMTHYRTNPENIIFDAAGNWNANPQPSTSEFGTGCLATGQTNPASLTAGAEVTWGKKISDLIWTGQNFPSDADGFLFIGSDSTTLGGGVNLPIAIPGTTGFPSGTCSLQTNIITALPIKADASGNMSLFIDDAPVGQVSNGGSLYSQAMLLDPTANGFGAVMTNVSQIHYIRPFGSTQSISHSYLNGDHGPVGTRVRYQGIVVRL